MVVETPKPIRVVSGRWMLARAGWLLLLALFFLAFAICQVLLYQELLLPCVGNRCVEEMFYLSATEIAELRAAGLPANLYAAFQVGMYSLIFGVNAALSTLIFWRRADDHIAVLVAFSLLLWGTTFTYIPETLWAFFPPAAMLLDVGGLLAGISFYWLCLFFPNGRFARPWIRRLALAMLCFPLLDQAWHLYVQPSLGYGIQPLLYAVFMPTTIAIQVQRYWRLSGPVERRQTRWAIFGIVACLSTLTVAIPVFEMNPNLGHGVLNKMLFNGSIYSSFLLVPVSIGVAILRARLWDIELLIGRALVYATLSACVAVLYVFMVGYLSLLFRAEDNLLIAVVATGIVAVLFQPLRSRLQRGVNRLLYGRRDDPYSALAHLGRRLEETLTPETALPTIVETIAEALKLPYVAIALATNSDAQQGSAGETFAITAAHGVEPTALVPHRATLSYQGDIVGQLLLAPRPGEREFSRADRRLLDDLARQAGVVVHAVQLQADLRRAHEAVITAREEERRRLRRDLHDGLGPTLATLTVQVDAARELLRDEPATADVLLADVTGQARSAIEDVRRLVYALRPPALDDLGLVGALRAHADRHAPSGIAIRIDAPDRLPVLPAAVEVAAFRIVQEALNNVVRHAGAHHCRVVLAELGIAPRRALAIEIEDDGVGLSPERVAGVGLAAMRERAEEVGGSFNISSSPRGGTRLSAYLPLR